MITYEPFWQFLKKKGISTYMLIYTYGINSYTIDRLRHDKPLKTSTIDNLCNRLHCGISDIMEHTEDSTDEYTPLD
ncbi:MAG: helix-turn-helix transcriptional regulator [Lachnospiraceae bacterium]|nr:helix-turn-helix transcriptional regulator [Lachnospiraceae bacterium]